MMKVGWRMMPWPARAAASRAPPLFARRFPDTATLTAPPGPKVHSSGAVDEDRV